MRTLLRTGVSAIALSLATSGAAWAANEIFDTDRDAFATVTGATSTQIGTTNLNDITGNTGQSFSGIMSMLQNGGANSVVNNGNAVTAIINTGAASTNEQLTTGTNGDKATQTATVTDSTSDEVEVDDDNFLDGFAFEQATGIVSVAQNNGANAAINNGNAVSGLVESGNSSGGTEKNFLVHARNDATVQGTGNALSEETDGGGTESTNNNVVQDDAFAQFTGIASVVQNNGANAAVNNGNAVAGLVATGAVQGALDFSVKLEQYATVKGNQTSIEEDDAALDATDPAGNVDDNLIMENAFQNAEGIVSVAQNNGANSAINNGNAVAGIVNSGDNVTANDVEFNSIGTDSNQIATVGGPGSDIGDRGSDDSPNNNRVTGEAFSGFEGVASVLQNNGPNSAINNGNTVSAIVLDSATITSGKTLLDSDSRQQANVNLDAGSGRIVAEVVTGQTDVNTLDGNAFGTISGVSSTVQNNGSNAAINNGNLVAAFLGEDNNADSNNDVTLNADSNSQSAIVQSGDGAIELLSNVESDASDDTNLLGGSTFGSAEGVHSVVQNNGANAAINNGNSVAGIIVDNAITDANAVLNVSQSQTAKVLANGDTVSSRDFFSADSNTASGTTFRSAAGVASVLQNNGANSAINNGNTVAILMSDDAGVDVAAGVLDGNVPGGPPVSQLAEVGANAFFSASESSGSLDENEITDDAFVNSEGVFSIGQNNGANAAINNGNTVAAAIADAGNVNASGGVTLAVNADQTARVGVAGSAGAGSVRSEQALASNDTNTMNMDAFRDASGVFSALQNNGASSAINNGNTVALLLSENNDVILNSGSGFDSDVPSGGSVSQTAEVNATAPLTITSTESTASLDTNALTGQAFQDVEGVFSVLQNNGPNSAINNGNTVAAAIADGASSDVLADDGVDFDVEADQTARVGTAGGGAVSSDESGSSHDTNTIDGTAFNQAAGVFSVLQNNGPNSAINNGNTVAAIIGDCDTCTGANSFTVNANFTGAVGALAIATSTGVTNINEINANAFQNARGVFSVTQNNGANAALSNGNVVAAIIDPG